MRGMYSVNMYMNPCMHLYRLGMVFDTYRIKREMKKKGNLKNKIEILMRMDTILLKEYNFGSTNQEMLNPLRYMDDAAMETSIATHAWR